MSSARSVRTRKPAPSSGKPPPIGQVKTAQQRTLPMFDAPDTAPQTSGNALQVPTARVVRAVFHQAGVGTVRGGFSTHLTEDGVRALCGHPGHRAKSEPMTESTCQACRLEAAKRRAEQFR